MSPTTALVESVRAGAQPLSGAASDYDALLERDADWHDAEAPETYPSGI